MFDAAAAETVRRSTIQCLAAQPHLDNLRVVLVSTRNPLNIGAVARAMSNFGVRHLRVVNPYEASFREARSAVGAAALLQAAEVFTSVAGAVADCSLVVGTTAARDRELQHPLRPLAAASLKIRRHLATGNVALLFESEKRGLSNDDLAHCHWLLRIPTEPGHPSMNLGQAVAVSLYELVRRQRTPAGGTSDPAKSEELERITGVLLEALGESGYLKPHAASATEDKLRRMLRRLKLNSTDAETLLGMLRKITWKLHHR